MKKLEDRILKKVYSYETKKTSFSLLFKLLIIFVSGFAAFLFTQILIEIFTEEQTFNFLEIFSEGWEVVSRHIGDLIFVIFNETPKLILTVALISAGILILASLTFIKNFGKMKNKIGALFRYWRRHD